MTNELRELVAEIKDLQAGYLARLTELARKRNTVTRMISEKIESKEVAYMKEKITNLTYGTGKPSS